MKRYINEADNRWEELTKLIAFPSWINTRKQFQSERLLEFALRIKHKEEYLRQLILTNNPQMPKDWPGSNHLQNAIAAERIIRKHLESTSLNQDKSRKGGEASKRKPDESQILLVKAFLDKHPIKNSTPTKIHTRIKNYHPNVSLSWLKKHINKFKLR